MLIALLKKLAVPVPIIGVLGAWLIRFKRDRQAKRTAHGGDEPHAGPAQGPTNETGEPSA
jgi:hypothetical protein